MTDTKGNDHADNNPRDKENEQSATESETRPSSAAAGDKQGDKSQPAPAADHGKTNLTASSAKVEASDSKKSAHPADKPVNAEPSDSPGKKPKGQPDKQPGKAATSGRASTGGTGSGRRRNHNTLALVVAVIALVIAIVAIAGAAWVWRQSQQTVTRLDTRIANVQKNVTSSVRSAVQPRLDTMQTHLDNIAEAGDQRAKELAKLQSNLKQTRMQVTGIAQRMQGDIRRWQLQQVEHLLVVANRRLQLYREPAQASAALGLASHMISRINDPRLFDVRKRVVDSIAALDALPSPDVEGMALTLSAFMEQIPNLPLASDLPQNYKPQSASTQTAEKVGTGTFGVDWSSGWQRFVDSIGHALHSMVTIRQADGTQMALLPPNQVYFLTQNLILQLRSARLALLEGNATLYRKSLSSAVDWLKQYFDTSDSAVKSMIERLGQMQNVKLDWQAPDISGSLHALRDYMQSQSQKDLEPSQEAGTEAGSSNRQQGAE